MNGTLADKEIHSIFSEFRFKLLNSTNIDASLEENMIVNMILLIQEEFS